MAENTRAVGSVTYREAGQGYFEKRQLRRHAAFWSLWALGVGGGHLRATSTDGTWPRRRRVRRSADRHGSIITIMYFGLCFTIAEMSPALPHTGGAYSFARSAMGPGAGSSPGWPRTWST